MAPQTGTALLIIAVFVLPGFVTLLMRERTYRVKGQDSSFERLLNALYFSSIIYVARGDCGARSPMAKVPGAASVVSETRGY